MGQPTPFTFATDALDESGVPTKDEFPDEFATAGLRKNTPWARIWHNYVFNKIGDYLTWFSTDVYKVGSIVCFKTGTEPDFVTDWVGTWVLNSTVGTVKFWERTA
jgi:hypothetical protein